MFFNFPLPPRRPTTRSRDRRRARAGIRFRCGDFDPLEQRVVPSLAWVAYGDASVSGDTITMGTPGDASDIQQSGFHGASAKLSPGRDYQITFDYDLSTWDAYNNDSDGGGFWDSFSVSVTGVPYPQLSILNDPLQFPFVWGGDSYTDGALEQTNGTRTITVRFNVKREYYLNVVLDTTTSPTADSAYPSWGSVTVRLADLTVDDFNYSFPTSSGTTLENEIIPINTAITVSGVVRNEGQADAGPFSVGFYISTDSTINPATDRLIKIVANVPSLAVGQSYQIHDLVTLPLNLPTAYFGEVWVGLAVDAANAVTESDETNNWDREPTLSFGDLNKREAQLYDARAGDGYVMDPTSGARRRFPTRADAEAYLIANGFTPPGLLDAGWSRPVPSAFSRFDGSARPAGAFRMQAGIQPRPAGYFEIYIQGGEPGYNPANLANPFGEPSPLYATSNPFDLRWLNYVRRYHLEIF
ncbi:CARDB domain-containing protein [Paludisphaera sp.]|uniref:CARDB domain-containing protein n=1 Tax=Paludisphaera sp. TaxID=2017432 RepID=UPI00301BE220